MTKHHHITGEQLVLEPTVKQDGTAMIKLIDDPKHAQFLADHIIGEGWRQAAEFLQTYYCFKHECGEWVLRRRDDVQQMNPDHPDFVHEIDGAEGVLECEIFGEGLCFDPENNPRRAAWEARMADDRPVSAMPLFRGGK